jgi:hypothetical protein
MHCILLWNTIKILPMHGCISINRQLTSPMKNNFANLRHPRDRFLVSNEDLPSWRPVEIFPTGVWDFSVLPSYRCLILFFTNILLKVQYFPYMKYDDRIKYICVFYFHFFVFLDVLFSTFDVILQWRQNMCHVIFHVWKILYFQTEKSQSLKGKISGLQRGSAELETNRNLSCGCLRFFRLALLPVFGVWFYFSLLSAVFSFVFVCKLQVNNASYFPFMSIKKVAGKKCKTGKCPTPSGKISLSCTFAGVRFYISHTAKNRNCAVSLVRKQCSTISIKDNNILLKRINEIHLIKMYIFNIMRTARF